MKFKKYKILEPVVRAIENNYLVEMAYDRKKFKDLIDDLSDQILENWCLIRYVSISKDKKELRPHWEDELSAYLGKIIGKTFKMNRRKAIEEVILGWLELNNNDDNHIIYLISTKFEEENIDIENEYVEYVVEDWITYGVYEVIDLLSDSKYKIATKNYVKTI